jgi:diguanylate cyclase (GGDEF)-like protein
MMWPFKAQAPERRARVRQAAPLPDELEDSLNDRLTGVLGRGAVLGHVARAIEAATAGENIAVAAIDIDHLRKINEAHGFLVGDQCLREVARRLAGCMREGDVLGRLEADDFLIVFRGLAGRMASGPFADRVQARLAEPIHAGDIELTIMAYAGVANWPLDGRTAAALVRAATEHGEALKTAAHAAAAFAGEPVLTTRSG